MRSSGLLPRSLSGALALALAAFVLSGCASHRFNQSYKTSYFKSFYRNCSAMVKGSRHGSDYCLCADKGTVAAFSAVQLAAISANLEPEADRDTLSAIMSKCKNKVLEAE